MLQGERVWQNEGSDPKWPTFDRHLRKESWIIVCNFKKWGRRKISSGHMDLTRKWPWSFFLENSGRWRQLRASQARALERLLERSVFKNALFLKCSAGKNSALSPNNVEEGLSLENRRQKAGDKKKKKKQKSKSFPK